MLLINWQVVLESGSFSLFFFTDRSIILLRSISDNQSPMLRLLSLLEKILLSLLPVPLKLIKLDPLIVFLITLVALEGVEVLEGFLLGLLSFKLF